MKVLVTGAAGFTGTWMMRYLSNLAGVSPTGLSHKLTGTSRANTPHQDFLVADLLNRDQIFSEISGLCPDAIIHLAGRTHGTLDVLMQTNVVGTKNLLEAGSAANPDCRILVVSSSAVYGNQANAPINESAPLQPLNEYGISKMAQDAYARMYYHINGAEVCIARPFNLIGPDQSESFVCGKIVKQVIEIERKKKNVLEIFETRSSRDFLDVRDAVRGYWALVSHPEFSNNCSGESFNMGSGSVYSIMDVILLIEGITGRHFEVKFPDIPPRVVVSTQQSNNEKITALTGWIPEIPFEESLRQMLDTARKKKI